MQILLSTPQDMVPCECNKAYMYFGETRIFMNICEWNKEDLSHSVAC